jgi:hypothetical protein
MGILSRLWLRTGTACSDEVLVTCRTFGMIARELGVSEAAAKAARELRVLDLASGL